METVKSPADDDNGVAGEGRVREGDWDGGEALVGGAGLGGGCGRRTRRRLAWLPTKRREGCAVGDYDVGCREGGFGEGRVGGRREGWVVEGR